MRRLPDSAVAEARAFWIACEGDALAAILHPAEEPAAPLGVVVVVGGPQYRVGSHRQFVLLARRLAAAGYPVLRFDFRGMGDSEGTPRDFERVEADLRAAIDAHTAASGVSRVVLWGLCDGASAALMYAPADGRVAGIIALNPWVHTAQAEAEARIRGYYLRRLASRDFWGKLLRFEFDWRDSFASLIGYARAAAGSDPGLDPHFLTRMEAALARFGGRMYVALSGEDVTADEFRLLLRSSPSWGRLAARKITLAELGPANHTFARREWRAWVEDRSLDWLQDIAAGST